MCERPVGTSVDDASLVEVAEGCWAWIQPDGTWWINNAGAVGGAGELLVVDTCTTAERTRKFLDAVAQSSGSGVSWAMNTHHHGDHTFGNSLLPAETPIIGHTAMRAALKADTMLDEFPDFWVPRPDLDGLRKRLPSVAIEDKVTIHLGDRRVEVVHPGHTAHTQGDLVVWVPDARVLYVGDLLFPGSTPMILAGSPTGATRVLEWIEGFGAEHVVSGHGPVLDAGELPDVLAEHEKYYSFVMDIAATAHESGLTLRAAAEAADVAAFSHLLESERLVLNVHSAYAELAGRRADRTAAFRDLMALNGGPVTTRI